MAKKTAYVFLKCFKYYKIDFDPSGLSLLKHFCLKTNKLLMTSTANNVESILLRTFRSTISVIVKVKPDNKAKHYSMPYGGLLKIEMKAMIH